jgi:hypothetical protein
MINGNEIPSVTNAEKGPDVPQDITEWAALYSDLLHDVDEDDAEPENYLWAPREGSPIQLRLVYYSEWEEYRGSDDSTREVMVNREVVTEDEGVARTPTRMIRHTCDITGRTFLTGIMAPVPALCYTPVASDGREHEEVQFFIHPRIAAGGPERIRGALRQKIRTEREQAAALLLNAHEMEQALDRDMSATWPDYWVADDGDSS